MEAIGLETGGRKMEVPIAPKSNEMAQLSGAPQQYGTRPEIWEETDSKNMEEPHARKSKDMAQCMFVLRQPIVTDTLESYEGQIRVALVPRRSKMKVVSCERKEEGDAVRFTIEAPKELARFIAPKGSVALDGTSLTVNRVEGRRFDVLLIHHSLSVTTWGERQPGDRVNLEVDTMARYAARLSEAAAEGL